MKTTEPSGQKRNGRSKSKSSRGNGSHGALPTVETEVKRPNDRRSDPEQRTDDDERGRCRGSDHRVGSSVR